MKSWKLLQTKYYWEKLSKKYVQYLDWKKQGFFYINHMTKPKFLIPHA